MSNSNWPGAYDTFHDPQASTRMNDPTYGHAAQHSLLNDAVSSIEQFLGATPNFNTVLNTQQAGGVLTGTFSNLQYVNPPSYGIPYTKTGTLTVTAGALRFPIYHSSATILGTIAMVNTAPSGAAIILDVLKNGTSIYTTTNNRPTIADGAFVSQIPYPIPDVTSTILGDYIQINILQIGSITPGSDLSVVVVTR